MAMNDEDNITVYSGIAFNDPDGDIKRIRTLLYSLINLVDDINSAWDAATLIDNISIRQGIMERLTDSINNLMLLVQSVDRMLIYDLRKKEGLTHAEE